MLFFFLCGSARRLSAAEALLHPWVLGEDWTAGEVGERLKAMDTEYVGTPLGSDPELWLAKLQGLREGEEGDLGRAASGAPCRRFQPLRSIVAEI
eukprot:COSAG01_NODE_10610_length_2122_cov_5.129511_1_plen_95_part_00